MSDFSSTEVNDWCIGKWVVNIRQLIAWHYQYTLQTQSLNCYIVMWVCGCGEQMHKEYIPIPIVLFPFPFLRYIQHHSFPWEILGIPRDQCGPSRSHSHAHPYQWCWQDQEFEECQGQGLIVQGQLVVSSQGQGFRPCDQAAPRAIPCHENYKVTCPPVYLNTLQLFTPFNGISTDLTY